MGGAEKFDELLRAYRMPPDERIALLDVECAIHAARSCGYNDEDARTMGLALMLHRLRPENERTDECERLLSERGQK